MNSGYMQVPIRVWLVMALAIIAMGGLLTGCGSSSRIASLDKSETLEELPRARIPSIEPVSLSSLDQVSESYREALELVADPVESENIIRRLALLELRQAEQVHLSSTLPDPTKIYKNAIQTYETLLEIQENRDDNDVLLYSLAKAKELSGDLDGALSAHSRLVREFPQSQYYSESQFRRGELLFSGQDYAQAAGAYDAVIQQAARSSGVEENPFLMNAHYMLGWSNFKMANYDRAMRSFVVVLDNANDVDAASINDRVKSESNATLSEDTYRVLALSFSYRNGAVSIADLLDTVGERNYADRLYGELASLYLDKKRYLDSADVLGSYIARYPASPNAPKFQQQKIDAFVAGRFPDKVREGKRTFASNYAIGSAYWIAANAETQAFVSEKLSTYIEELAAYHHSLAQKLAQNLAQQQKETGQELADRGLSVNAKEEYRNAAFWYEEWIRSFPEADDVAGKYFLAGETRFEAGDYAESIAAYEIAAYSYPEFDKAAESGYAALLAYDQLITGLSGERVSLKDNIGISDTQDAMQAAGPVATDWTAMKIESALMFAENFTGDVRRSPVLGQTVETLLAREEYTRTIDVASLLLASEPISFDLKLTGHLSSAHAHKALALAADTYDAGAESFKHAENAYREALGVMQGDLDSPQTQKFYGATVENYAASIYKQGELANAGGNPEFAASQFLRVVELAPDSSIRVTAQHDASVLLMQTGQWQEAITVIRDFEQRFPAHESNQTAAARLLQANQAIQNWPAAAEQAMRIYQNDADPQARREALYLAAELYEKAGLPAQAIASYREYAHGYPSPLAERMEAQLKLTELYETEGADSKRMFWINKLVETHDAASEKTDRSYFLAAFASSELAGIDWHNYQRISLDHPLKKSLAVKRRAMDRAIARYEKTHDYGVAEFTTLATQRMGEIYASFAVALLDSERPQNLSELEREQYDMLLEEQAYPFEEQAIEFYRVNVERVWQGTRTAATTESFEALANLMPAKYSKHEIRPVGF